MRVLASLVLLISIVAPAGAGVTVSSYRTVAGTNAYAPLSQAMYFDKKTLNNTSPAVVDVADDWTGTNDGGSTNTWQWVGSAHVSTTTSFSSNNLTIMGE